MYNCTYILEPNPDYGYIVRVKELPGLADDGKTPEEAIKHIQIDIEMALELRESMGQPIKGVEKLDPGKTVYTMTASSAAASV